MACRLDPQDQRSKILTYNIAPAWTHLLSPTTLLTFGAFVRQDQYNYYGSDNPYADFTPDLQTQRRRPGTDADQCGRARQSLLCQGHSQHQGRRHL